MQLVQMSQDNRQALAGIVQCRLCGSPMVRLGPDYTCPNTLEQHPSHQNSANADKLLITVIDHVMKLVMTEKTVQSVVEKIREETRETARRHRQQLDHTEQALDQLKARETELLEQQDLPGELDPTDELAHIGDQGIALGFEARKSARELRALDFVMDEDRLRANALNPETYRDPNRPGQTAQVVRTFIRSVEVAPEEITLKFMMPIPTEQEPKGALEDTIPMP